MSAVVMKWLGKRYPQNIIIRKPLLGTLIFLASCICFVIIYKPLQVHDSRFFGFRLTVAIYCIIIAIPLSGLVKLLKRISFFSDAEGWTFLREILSFVILLSGMGVAAYFTGFIMEEPGDRWNMSTFINSIVSVFLIGLVPFMFFTLLNYRYLFVSDVTTIFNANDNQVINGPTENIVRISSRLKKENLSFYPSQLLFAESDGNYIVFTLEIENKTTRRTIRNSISEIEMQLSEIPFLFRTHRAFIVNVNRVISQKGNSLGYRLRLSGTDVEIPVARQKTRDFEQTMKKFH